jgi:hypothetical protein
MRPKSLIGPIHNWAASSGKLSLKLRHYQDDADCEKQTCRRVTEHVSVEADRVSDRGDEQADPDKRCSEPCSQRYEAQSSLRSSGTENDWQERQHARR